MGSYSKYNKNYSNNRYQNNKHYKDDDSDYEYTKAEVERNLILCNRLDFNYKKYEVYKAYVAFTDNEDIFKSRPIIVVRDNGDSVTCLKCTSKRYDTDSYWEKCPIEDWVHSGFSKPSYVILTHTIEINKKYIFKRLGKLSSEDIDNIREIGL